MMEEKLIMKPFIGDEEVTEVCYDPLKELIVYAVLDDYEDYSCLYVLDDKTNRIIFKIEGTKTGLTITNT